MDTWKIKCEMPDKEIISLDCEPQNIKEELQKKTNKITCDSIILVEISNTECQTSNGLGLTIDNQLKNQMYFKVYDANQLQRELKEMERIKAEKEQQIKEIQDKYNTLEIDLNKMINKSNSQEQIILQLSEQNQILQNKNKELHIEVIQITSEKNSINQVWQACCSCLSQQMSQLCLNTLNANQVFQMKSLESLQIQVKVLEDQLRCSQKETDEQKYMLKQAKEKLRKDNNSDQKLENFVEEMKQKEKQHHIDKKQVSETNKNGNVDKEILTMKAEKEKQIQEIQGRRDKLELDLNQMNTRCSNLEQNIQQLQEEIQQQQRSFEIQLQKKNEELQNEINKKNQEIQTVNAEWQNYYGQITTQFQQQLQQYHQMTTELEVQIEYLQKELGEEQYNSKSETDKLKQLLKAEKDKLVSANDFISQLDSTIEQLNVKNKKLDRDLKQSKDKITELEMNQRNTIACVNDANIYISQKEQDIKKLQNTNKSQANEIEDLKNDLTQLTNQKQQLDVKTINQQQETIQYRQKIEELNDEIERLKGDLRILQQQKDSVDSDFKDLKNQLQQTKEQLQQQQSGRQNNEKQIEELKSQITKLEQEVKTVYGQYKDSQQTVREQKIKIQEREGLISVLEIKFSQSQNSLKQKDEQLKNDQTQKEKYRIQMDDIINEMKQEMDQTNLKLNMKDHILQKLSRKDDNYFDKVTGVMEKIMSTPYKIIEMNKDANALFSVNEFEIFEISTQYDLAKQLLIKNQYFLFEQCLKKTPKGRVTLNVNLNDAKSTFFKGYLSVVNEATENEFKGKYLLRKDLIYQNQPFISLDDAAQMSINNFLCQLLMEQFNKVLTSQKLKAGDFRIGRQFVLKPKDKDEYYYNEMVEEGEFQKINGGVFQPKKKNEVDSYFNAFSKYVYAFSKEQYIISHLQICGKTVYDMIVSTNYKGLFSPLDQGKNEIQQVLEIIDYQPVDAIKLHWSEKIQEIAKQGVK